MTPWRIYYRDGTTFDNTQGAPHEAPSEFFICALGYGEDSVRYMLHGWNYYRWDKESEQWWGFDRQGLHTRLRHNDEVYAYKEGYTVTKTLFNEITDRAHRDPGFPMVVRK